MPSMKDSSVVLNEERTGPFSVGGFVIMLTAVAAAVVVTVVILQPPPIATGTRAGDFGAKSQNDTELLAPVVTMKEPVLVSVPNAKGGGEFHIGALSVAIKLGRPQGHEHEELNLNRLENVYVPRVRAMLSEVRHLLITLASQKPIEELRGTDSQLRILERIKNHLNERLDEHGLEKRVKNVYWHTCHFD